MCQLQVELLGFGFHRFRNVNTLASLNTYIHRTDCHTYVCVCTVSLFSVYDSHQPKRNLADFLGFPHVCTDGHTVTNTSLLSTEHC